LAFSFEEKPDGIVIKRDGRDFGTYNVITGKQCPSCSYPLLPNGHCRGASKHSSDLTKIYSIGMYYKYDHKTYDQLSARIVYLKKHMAEAEPLGATIAHLIKSKHKELLHFDCIVPIPQHPDGMKEDILTKARFNQAVELAKWIHHYLPEIPVIEALIKTRNESLRNATDSERNRMTTALYQGNAKMVKGKKVLLIDDVSTAGYTMNRCATELKNLGATEVRAFVCGINHLD
jgi:predicted amidophosphoribosyltransferase